MFGPSEARCISELPLECFDVTHHRSFRFHKLYQNLIGKFRERFSIPDDHMILPVAGSGTTAIETVLASLDCRFSIQYPQQTKSHRFTNRLKDLADFHSDPTRSTKPKGSCLAFVAYETSACRPFDIEKQIGKADVLLVDCVSSFPYYEPVVNGNANTVWVAVNCKQIGAAPIMAFIVLGQGVLPFLKDESASTLSLKKLIHCQQHCELPHTPPIGLLSDTYTKLCEMPDLADFRAKLNTRRAWVQAALDHIIGPGFDSGEGPVMGLPKTLHPDFIHWWDLYPGELGPQVFLHAGNDMDYKMFCEELRRPSNWA